VRIKNKEKQPDENEKLELDLKNNLILKYAKYLCLVLKLMVMMI